MLRVKATVILWLLCSAGVIAYLVLALPKVQWNSNITAALPQAGEQWQQQLLQQNQSSRQITLLLTGLPLDTLQLAAEQIQHQPLTDIAWYQPGEMLQQLKQQYQNSQGLLATEQHLTLLKSGDYSNLIQAAWQRLLSPAPLLDNAMQADPLLLTQQFAEQQATVPGGLQVHANWLQTDSSRTPAILLLARIQVDPFDRKAAATLAASLELQLQQMQQQWPGLQIARSGVLFHAVTAAERASFEMQFYGGLSLAGILLLLWFSFGSIKPLVMALTVLLSATACGLAALIFLFPQPHILALVFATTLTGIAIDYSFHGMLAANHGRPYFNRMLPSLLLGLGTTILGYLALTILPFAVLNQVAVFICAGLTAAFITVTVIFPRLIAAYSLPSRPIVLNLTQAVSSFYLSRNRKIINMLVLVAVVSLPSLLTYYGRFIDDVRLFNQSPASLLAQEQLVRQFNGMQWDSRFIVVMANDSETLLRAEHKLAPLLTQWQQQGYIGRWQAVSQQVPAKQRQDELQLLLQQAYDSPEVRQYLTQLQLAAPETLQHRLDLTGIATASQPQLLSFDTHLASIIFLTDTQVPADAIDALQQLPQVYWFDPIADATESVAHIRDQLMIWLALALGLAILFLGWRLGIQTGATISVFLLIVVSGSLLISLVVQQQLSIFNLVAALLVMALALDYAVFFASELPHAEVCQAVMLSAVTSCLAFGVLSFSQTPAIAGFGFTVFCGVALASLLAPFISIFSSWEYERRGAI